MRSGDALHRSCCLLARVNALLRGKVAEGSMKTDGVVSVLMGAQGRLEALQARLDLGAGVRSVDRSPYGLHSCVTGIGARAGNERARTTSPGRLCGQVFVKQG